MIEPTLRVVVEPLDVRGETVTFRWTQSQPNRFQENNTFFFRYEDMDLSVLATDLFYEIFLALQLRVFSDYPGHVQVVFPTPVPRPTVEFWQAFNGAEHVQFEPIAEVESYSPWADKPVVRDDPRAAAVSFGGGKDSTLAACLLSEIYGPDQVLLFQFVGPMKLDATSTERLERRQEEMMLRPTRQSLGVATQRVWTDYQAQFRPEGHHLRPNLELYTVGSLPLLLHWGASICTYSMPWHLYDVHPMSDGTQKYQYARSRPEALREQKRHYERAFGADIMPVNITMPFSTLHAYQMLVERYPHAFPNIVMCMHAGPGKRWCYHCKEKCALHAIFSLVCGVPDPDFNYEYFFRKSHYIEQLNDYASTGVELTMHGNAPWTLFFSAKRTYILLCHVLAKLEPEAVPAELSPEARGNLALWQALFGNRLFPQYDQVPVLTFDLLGPELGPKIREIVAQHFEIIDEIPGPHLMGNTPVIYDFSGTMPTKTAHVAHIRD